MALFDLRTAIRPRDFLALCGASPQRCGRAVALAAAAQPIVLKFQRDI